jgi:hypothetical protein
MDSELLYFAVLILQSLITDKQTPSFRMHLFSDLPEIVSLLELLGCVFDTGLLPMLRSGTPPTLTDLKSIAQITRFDSFFKDKWGVYFTVLEKSGYKPKLYVGSSVGVQEGLQGRMADYRFVL